MKPNKLTAYELFDVKRRYVVPLFQRPYVWTREAQWEPLWADITFKADQIIERDGNDDIGSVPLLPSDLIRNFVFLEASKGGEDVERLYNEYWLHYDDYQAGHAAFWKE